MMKKTVLLFSALACLTSFSAQAEDAPAPRRMPRTPVSSEVLVQARDPMPASRQVQGPAAIIDGEKLRVGETDLRLFGIVPPQLSASFGPQARTALDTLANGQAVTCQIRDRDRDGRLLATCHNSNNTDMALELLKRGLAVTARGSIAGTEVATTYLTAEQAAQSQKLGLWSMAPPQAVSAASMAVPVQAKQETAPAPAPVVVATDAKKDDKITLRADKSAAADSQISATQAKIAADVISEHAQTQARLDDAAWAPDESVGFFERYQILIAGFLMLATALSILAVLWVQKHRDRLDEIKAVAAALRGELMAARAICLGRLKSITSEDEDRAAIWPRIRATLYQAYVGRLGVLGAELARQISSVYGQSSDYTALYNNATIPSDVSKRQALETLARHIEEILPKLAHIEKTGNVLTVPAFFQSRINAEPLKARPQPQAQTVHSTIPASAVATPTPSVPRASHEPIGKVFQSVEMHSDEEEAGEPHEKTAPYNAAEATPVSAPVAALNAVLESTDQHAAPAPALWEAVRHFIQKPRHTYVAEEASEDTVSDYAAMIEADMARYQYTETMESLDSLTQKKRAN